MILDSECGFFPVPDSFHGVIVQVDMGDFQTGRKPVGIQREIMVLAGDFDLSGQQIFYRMIAAVMPELESAALRTVASPSS